MRLIDIAAAGLAAYAAAGILFAAAFMTVGVDRIDPQARGSSWRFRLLIVPGVAVLWPILLKRWAAGFVEVPTESNAHRRAAREVER